MRRHGGGYHGYRGSPRRSGAMHRGAMRPAAMRMVFILIDTDGNGTLSLAEISSVTERIFNAADADGNGELTALEIRRFAHGRGPFGMNEAASSDEDDDTDTDSDSDTAE